MDAETGFLIEGTVYPVPTWDSLTMGERHVMFDLAGITEEDLMQQDGESEEDHDERVDRATRHPGFMHALMHIAYQRGNPQMRRDKVSLVVDNTNYLDAMTRMSAAEEDADESPLASTTPLEQPSGTGSDGSSERSGQRSTTGLDPQDDPPVPTGIGRSGTSSPASVPATSAS